MAGSEELPIVTKDAFDDMVLQSSKPAVIFCYLKDSGLCNIKQDEFRKLAQKHSAKIKFLRLDIDRNKDLALEYGVRSVPALLIFNRGEVLDRMTSIGYADNMETFVEKIGGSRFDRLPAGLLHVTESNFEETVEHSAILTILNFWKHDHEPSWMLIPEFQEMTEKYKDKVRFCIANFDDSRDLATRFRVFHVPTMLFLRKGEALDRLLGLQPRSTVEKSIRSIIEER